MLNIVVFWNIVFHVLGGHSAWPVLPQKSSETNGRMTGGRKFWDKMNSSWIEKFDVDGSSGNGLVLVTEGSWFLMDSHVDGGGRLSHVLFVVFISVCRLMRYHYDYYYDYYCYY